MKPKLSLWAALLWIFFISACSLPLPNPENTVPANTPSVTLAAIETPTLTAIPATDTPTPEPLAARVNGEGILMREFEEELARYRQSGVALAEQAGQTVEVYVLNTMIDERLLAQAAAAQGFIPSEADIQSRLDNLNAQVDLQSWMVAQGYDENTLRRSLKRAIQAAWMRDQIVAGVSARDEQVHAVQILLYNSTDAAEAYRLAQSTDDFLVLAREYNPVTGGEMGWFAQGSLFYPSLEEAAFSLQPGTFSEVIQTELGYHILFIVDRQVDRQLDPETLRNRQSAAIATWFANQRKTAAIEILINQVAP